VKEHSERHAGNKAEQQPEPGDDQIELKFHLRWADWVLKAKA
jgi:hypothetical protein